MNGRNEIVIISGKGGTGKTTLALSIAPYLNDAIFADCDVDAPDFDIVLSEKKEATEGFYGNKKAHIDAEKCVSCGACLAACRFGAISQDLVIHETKCEGCRVCEFVCPNQAIVLSESRNGELFTSSTPYGKLFHARLKPGEENSGRLVSLVRKKAKAYAKEQNKSVILVDGAPGIACNVISSMTGAKEVIIVTEPTLSGLHDLERVYAVTQKLRLPVSVVINKYDISESISADIETFCKTQEISKILKIPFDKRLVQAISNLQIPSLVEKEFFQDIGFFDFIAKFN